ncbi:MAG: YqaE/Pmp3 family membrane protein [Alphaproteobacteria bacterium]
MLYLVSIVVPPLGILLCGKLFQAVFNLILLVFALLILVGTLGLGSGVSFVFWILAIVHGLFAVHSRNQAQRDQKIIDALKNRD